jgi:AP endonuclease-2
MDLKVVSWNINGLSTIVHYHPWNSVPAPFKVAQLSFLIILEQRLILLKELLDHLDADIICFQEHKLQRKDITFAMANVPGYDAYFSFSKVKKGYSGV